jgi:hypothetical protein
MHRTLQLGLACAALFFAAAQFAAADLIAYDYASLDDPYGNDNTFMPGQNGGTGFGAWEDLLGLEANGSMFLGNAIDGDGVRSWEIGGTYALGRSLADPRDSFVWSFLAVHNAAGSFSGFNLKTNAGDGFSGGEVLRFGMDPADDSQIAVSIDQGDTYASFAGGWFNGTGDTLLYTVAWNNGAYAIGVSNLTQEVGAQFFGSATPGAIEQFGAAVEGGLGDGLRFDQFAVAPIPEPATATCLLLGACLLWKTRRRGKRN